MTAYGTRLVDTEVLDVVIGAAQARLQLVQDEELRSTGAAETTLARVARKALLGWEAPPDMQGTAEGPTRYRKVSAAEIREWMEKTTGRAVDGPVTKEMRANYRRVHNLTVSPFRFSMPVAALLDAKAKIHSCGLSVAGVVQDALEQFARTGKY